MKKVGRFFQFLQNRPTEAELRQRLNDIQDELQRDNTENNEHLVRDIIELFGRDANIYQSDVQYIEYIRNAIGGIPRDINMNVRIMRKLRTMKNRIDSLRIDLNMEETSKISDIIKYIKNSGDNTDGWLMNRIQNINVPAFNRLNSNINEIRRLYGDYNETTKNVTVIFLRSQPCPTSKAMLCI
jgi:predicted RNase H-like nuclease (RuvC/YqgF family)